MEKRFENLSGKKDLQVISSTHITVTFSAMRIVTDNDTLLVSGKIHVTFMRIVLSNGRANDSRLKLRKVRSESCSICERNDLVNCGMLKSAVFGSN